MEGGKGHRAGYVGVLGQTNVGKSTFLNAALGHKLVITSSKPQTTRNRVRCILTSESSQIVFLDTPGLHQPENKLGRHIQREAYRSLRGLDVILYVVEPWGSLSEFDRRVFERWTTDGRPVFLLVNKIDLAKGNTLAETLLAYAATDLFAELIPLSAATGEGVAEVIKTLIPYLPESPRLFPAETTFDHAEEFLIGELIREKVTRFTYREIPYSSAVLVKWLNERADGLVEIKAEIIVERESQKGIIVGKGGRLIRHIGTLARTEIEALLGSRVFLDLIVKVRPNWTRDAERIQELTGQT